MLYVLIMQIGKLLIIIIFDCQLDRLIWYIHYHRRHQIHSMIEIKCQVKYCALLLFFSMFILEIFNSIRTCWHELLFTCCFVSPFTLALPLCHANNSTTVTVSNDTWNAWSKSYWNAYVGPEHHQVNTIRFKYNINCICFVSLRWTFTIEHDDNIRPLYISKWKINARQTLSIFFYLLLFNHCTNTHMHTHTQSHPTLTFICIANMYACWTLAFGQNHQKQKSPQARLKFATIATTADRWRW